mmetsp:Transcript_1091/g.3584  ORF Transcript_1091/g.3584 Transcript_1091/m.3584 type:complete len:102 (-) Transcript_1091:4799-5104(-)
MPQLQSDHGHLPACLWGGCGGGLGRLRCAVRGSRTSDSEKNETRQLGRFDDLGKVVCPFHAASTIRDHAPGAEAEALTPLLLPEPPNRFPNMSNTETLGAW